MYMYRLHMAGFKGRGANWTVAPGAFTTEGPPQKQ